MQDRPTASELLLAVQRFLEVDVVPALEGTKKFHARVAANVLAIVRREIEMADAQEHAEWRRLASLFGDSEEPPADWAERRRRLIERTEQLCARIRAGEADDGAWREQVLAHVHQTVVEKLLVANPKDLGLEAANR